MNLITTQTVTYEVEVSEQSIRAALVAEAQELDDLFHNLSVREAYGLDRETGTRIDNWVPQILRPNL